ncbi:MAG: hypothetical protein ACRERE_23550 [Candidatus Entotheonellia bacterium]
MANPGYIWLKLAAIGSAILADFTVADKGEEAWVPWMHGLTAGGMGIAHGPHNIIEAVVDRQGDHTATGRRSNLNARQEHDR